MNKYFYRFKIYFGSTPLLPVAGLHAEPGEGGADLVVVCQVELAGPGGVAGGGAGRQHGLLRALAEGVVFAGRGAGAARGEGSLIVLGGQSVSFLPPAQTRVVHPTCNTIFISLCISEVHKTILDLRFITLLYNV